MVSRIRVALAGFKEWLKALPYRCPKCKAHPDLVMVWGDGEVLCTKCGYHSYEGTR